MTRTCKAQLLAAHIARTGLAGLFVPVCKIVKLAMLIKTRTLVYYPGRIGHYLGHKFLGAFIHKRHYAFNIIFVFSLHVRNYVHSVFSSVLGGRRTDLRNDQKI